MASMQYNSRRFRLRRVGVRAARECNLSHARSPTTAQQQKQQWFADEKVSSLHDLRENVIRHLSLHVIICPPPTRWSQIIPSSDPLQSCASKGNNTVTISFVSTYCVSIFRMLLHR